MTSLSRLTAVRASRGVLLLLGILGRWISLLLLTWRLPEQKHASTGLVYFAHGEAAVYTVHTQLCQQSCLSATQKPLLLAPETCSSCRHSLRG